MCEDDLKPCPFCHASPSDIMQNAWVIQCIECGALIPGQYTQAREKWNRRHLENSIQSQLRASLRAAYEVYAGSDGFIPETAAEGYQQQIIKQMVAEIEKGLRQ
jgi:hypothetical protein